MDQSNLYFGWLVSLVDGDRADQYPIIFHVAWDMEFIYSIPTDANRAQDGLDLRSSYERNTSQSLPDLGPCRVLEFLVALSMRMDYILLDYNNEDQAYKWFWQMMFNMGLLAFNGNTTTEKVNNILYKVMVRDYDDAGRGGLFPLKNPRQDQRDIEIWYQMHAWISERNQTM